MLPGEKASPPDSDLVFIVLAKIWPAWKDNSAQSRIAASSSTNGVKISSALTMKRFPSPRCASGNPRSFVRWNQSLRRNPNSFETVSVCGVGLVRVARSLSGFVPPALSGSPRANQFGTAALKRVSENPFPIWARLASKVCTLPCSLRNSLSNIAFTAS